MTHYTVLIDGEDGAYGVIFPDLPGCAAMGGTIDTALANAVEALRDWTETVVARGGVIPDPRTPDLIRGDPTYAEDFAEGAILGSVVLVRSLGRPRKANLSLDSGVLAAIDETAGRLGITRSALVERIAREKLPELA